MHDVMFCFMFWFELGLVFTSTNETKKIGSIPFEHLDSLQASERTVLVTPLEPLKEFSKTTFAKRISKWHILSAPFILISFMSNLISLLLVLLLLLLLPSFFFFLSSFFLLLLLLLQGRWRGESVRSPISSLTFKSVNSSSRCLRICKYDRNSKTEHRFESLFNKNQVH